MYNIGMSLITKEYYRALKSEILKHIETKEQSERRMNQIRFLLLENHQLHKELKKERELSKDLMLEV